MNRKISLNLLFIGGLSVLASLSGCGGSSKTSDVEDGIEPKAMTSATRTSASSTVSSSTLSTTTSQPTVETTATTTPTTIEEAAYEEDQLVPLHFESRVPDVSSQELETQALRFLNDPKGWIQAGFTFTSDPQSKYKVVLAEGAEVDQLCLPLRTFRKVSCQNGTTVALNADRWRTAVEHWELGVDVYRGYLINHEVGHLIGQRHPIPRCPNKGALAGVMEQQTAGLEGCIGNPWPREWEIDYAKQRPVIYAPLPAWGPDPVPANKEP